MPLDLQGRVRAERAFGTHSHSSCLPSSVWAQGVAMTSDHPYKAEMLTFSCRVSW